MRILELWGISFHPVVVVGLGNDRLFNFTVGHCVEQFFITVGQNNFGKKIPFLVVTIDENNWLTKYID